MQALQRGFPRAGQPRRMCIGTAGLKGRGRNEASDDAHEQNPYHWAARKSLFHGDTRQTTGNCGTQSQRLRDGIPSYARSAATGKPLETAGQQSQRLKSGVPLYARSATGYFASEQFCKERKNCMKIYKTLRKRGLALFLALTMCLSLIQTTALADDLTSPADEGTICGIPAHTHTGECCAPGSELACGLEEAECHTHDEACFAVSEKLACTLEETGTAGGHTHDSACWGPLTELVCGIPEGEDHVHDGSCYQPVTELICGLEEDESHTHEDACCAPVEGLICGQEEAEAVEGHTHSAECYVTESVQICELEQTEGHVHGEDCYNTVLACGLDEHEHDAEDCYPVPADVQDFLELAERLPAPEDRIYVTVLVDGSNGYPSEPSIVKDRVFLSLKDKNTLKRLDNNEPWLNDDYTQYIDKKIWEDPDFKESLYDEGTYGLFDVTGSKIKEYFKSEFDWDKFLGVIGAFHQEGVSWVIATDGKKPRENPYGDDQGKLEDYEVVPYVIKFQPEGAECPGWHIDCRVVPKSWVSLSYDHNLPSGTTVENLTMPDSKDGDRGFGQMIQKAVWGSSEVETDGMITASYGIRDVTLKFLGWNTAADGSGTEYAPGDSITVNKDTVLYAQWEVEKPEYKVEFYYQNSVGSESYTCKDTEIRNPSMNDFASGTVKIADSDKTPSDSVTVPAGAAYYEFDEKQSTVETAIIAEGAVGYPAVLKVYFKLTETSKPAFTVYKSVSPTTDVKAGTELTYTIVVKNTGNVTLEQFALTDTMTARKTAGEGTANDTPAGIRTLDSEKSTNGVRLEGNIITIPALEQNAEATIVYKYTVGAKDEGKTLVNTITEPENLDKSSGTENNLTTETAAAVTRITISGEKTWEDNGNAAGKRPESITVKLMNGNIEADSRTVSAGDDGKWSYSFEANKFDAEGREITYTIAEETVPGYTPTVNSYDIINTIQSVGYTVEFYKDSTDAANKFGKVVTGTAPYGSIIARFATDKMIQDHAPGAGYGTGAVVSEDLQKTIGLTESENVIRVLYLAEKQPVPDTLSYTVDYLEQGTNKKLADTKTVSTGLTLGTEVTETAISISGYTPVAPIETVITIQAEGNAITFYYTANAAPDAGAHTLTIHYVYENGTAAAPDHVEKNLAEGIAYDVPSPARDGYIADLVRVTGRMENEDAEHTVIYRADRIGGGNDGKKPDGIPDSFEAVVYYSVNNTRYGTVAASYQTFNLGPDKSDARTLRNTASATALSRVYFIDWTLEGSRLDVNTGLNRSLTVESGEVYYVVANFGRRSTSGGNEGGTGGSSGGGNSGGSNGGTTVIPDTQTPLDPGITIDDQEVPLAGAVGLNDADHFAYVIGYEEDGTVRPLNNISRAEVATIFFRLMTEEFRQSNWSTVNSFIDVEEGDWYNNAVSTCAKAGILTGYEDGSFKPNASITRAEFAAVAARFLDDSYVDDGKGDFSDTADHWAASYIRLAAKAGWINGSGNRFDPEEYITRAQVMTIVNRMLDRTPDKDHMLPSMKTWTDNPEGTWYYEAVQEATNEHDYTRDEMSVETWTLVKQHRDWAAIELGWAANNGASAPQTKPETETQSLPDGI